MGSFGRTEIAIRVVDVWISHEQQGFLEIGRHVFLELAVQEDDRPWALSPDRYAAPQYVRPSRDW